ncbi:hypothetical protein HBA55_37080, partial [Pseudomaricurvus alkylphenolicus]|uniref:hypothetical protein n=1 Tax=Pseudomaricurvus alkylphenolicus TaxID=1306991 RepID=UPI00141EAECB
GELLRASGNLDINVADFFSVNGGFAFEKASEQITLDDGSQVSVDLITLGAEGVNAFAGLNAGTDEALGFALEDVDLALALMSDQADSTRQWHSLKADAGSAGFLGGGDDLVIEASTLEVVINQAGSDGSLVDYAAQALTVAIGPDESLQFDMDAAAGELLQASGELNVNIANFFSVSGGFALLKSSRQMTLSDGAQVDTDLLTLGANDAAAFVGVNGGSEDATGFELSGVDLAVALITDQNDGARQWASVQAEADSAAFVGVEDLTIGGDTMSVSLNLASNDGVVVDYAAQSLEVSTGPDSSITLTMDGSDGELLRASGNLDINVADFFSVNGGFAFEKASEQITLDDGSQVSVDLITLGAEGVNAFAGLNAGTDEALGFALEDVDLALALMSDQADSTRQWHSLKADAGSAGFLGGGDDLVIEASTLEVVINQAGSDGSLVDYAAQALTVAIGPDESLQFDMDAAAGELLQASGELNVNIANFFSVSGGFALLKSSRQMTLSDGAQVDTDLLTLGANDAAAFVGVNGG